MFQKIALILSVVFVGTAANAASIVMVQNSTVGQFISNSGSALTSGGVSVGYFTGAEPTDSQIQALTAGTAFADLMALGFVDVRTTTITSALPDWDNPAPASGTVQYTFGNPGTVPGGKQLYVLAFDSGSFVSGTPSTSFAGSTGWAVVKETTFTSPTTSLGSAVFNLQNATGLEVIVGGDLGDNSGKDVRLSAIPEPSRALLGMIGLVALFVRRRR